LNNLEKRSFYSFLGLYLVSSFLFILAIGFWYYTAQKNALQNENYYQLEHIADVKSGDIIMSHMKGVPLNDRAVPDNVTLALIDINGKVVNGKLWVPAKEINKPVYMQKNNYTILVSDAPREHLNIRYVVVQSNALFHQIQALQRSVLTVIFFSFLFVSLVAWILSKLFMKPIHQRVEQIEQFINDVTHELNTPITSLSMATEQALKQEKCTPNTLKNISISTKQLYDIYRSLTYLNFAQEQPEAHLIDISEVLQKSVAYYEALAQSKRIEFELETKTTMFRIPETQTQLLFGNLIGNAIKYSPANSTIRITLKEHQFSIKDEGIGIEPKEKEKIFERFQRATSYSGGFGVGLSIVKSICDAYGIDVSFDSIPQKGTEFRLHFKSK
jgi:two-component system OmpR family sensor kinase